MRLILSIVLLAIFSLACKTKRPATSEKPVDTTAVNQTDTINTRFVVRFYSPGSGAEFPFINAFEDSIGAYSLFFGKNIDYRKNIWGPEGETDFCLRLNELTESEQKLFINKSRMHLEKAKWVHIYENFPCPKMVRHRK